MKAKDEAKKAALSSLKSKITEAEKANQNKELDNDGVLKVIASSIKQRKQSIDSFVGRDDLIEKETAEMIVLESYLPKQMDDSEIKEKIILLSESITSENRSKRIGMIIGSFNKQYRGQADPQKVKSIAEILI
jgi:uncharacterized protein YqeY